MGDVKSVRDIIDQIGLSEKVPKGSELAKEIGNRVKLQIVPKLKEQRPNDTWPVNYYEENHWDRMMTVVRVTVAEHTVETTKAPVTPITFDTVFTNDKDGNITVNQNSITRAYLFSLLRPGIPRPKQSFACEPERIAYKKRIIDLMNAIWMPSNPHEDLDLNAEPYIWCKDKKGGIDMVVANLTEILLHKGTFGGTTLKEILVELGIKLDSKAIKSLLHYELELIFGYKVYNRVLKIGNVAAIQSTQWPNDDWPDIVLTQKEAIAMKGLLIMNYSPSIIPEPS